MQNPLFIGKFLPHARKEGCVVTPCQGMKCRESIRFYGKHDMQMSWMEISLNFLTIPNDTHNFSAPVSVKKEIPRAVTSVAIAMICMYLYPCDAAFAVCNMTLSSKHFLVTWKERILCLNHRVISFWRILLSEL